MVFTLFVVFFFTVGKDKQLFPEKQHICVYIYVYISDSFFHTSVCGSLPVSPQQLKQTRKYCNRVRQYRAQT